MKAKSTKKLEMSFMKKKLKNLKLISYTFTARIYL